MSLGGVPRYNPIMPCLPDSTGMEKCFHWECPSVSATSCESSPATSIPSGRASPCSRTATTRRYPTCAHQRASHNAALLVVREASAGRRAQARPYAASISSRECSIPWRRLAGAVGQATTAAAAVAMCVWRSRYRTIVAVEEPQTGRGDFAGM